MNYLRNNNLDRTIATQLLRSGTSIGANVAEAKFAQSKTDFISKLSIALKEANETDYWLRILFSSNYLSKKQFASIDNDCNELIKILVSIIKTSKQTN